MQKISQVIRIPEHNDWVFFALFGCILALVLTLRLLHREASVRDFILQDAADTRNIFPTWIIISTVFAVLFATLVSQYIPAEPKVVERFSILGFSLNKMGFAFSAIAGFYFVRILFTYVFYLATGQPERWERFYFAASKYYLLYSALLCVAVFVKYFFDVDQAQFLFYGCIAATILFIIKNIYYLADPQKILPKEWYYKILYICTLQFAPVLGLWKLLFL